MDTWVKFQIDYLERQIGRTFKPKEKKLIAWFLKLTDKEQVEVIKLENTIRHEIINRRNGTPKPGKTL